MSMETKKIALAAAIALLAGGASAEPMSWTEIGVGFNVADASGDNDTDAFDIRGGIGFAEIGHAQLTYLDGTVDGGEGSDFDFDGFELRAGVHPSVGEKTQVVAEALYFDYEGDFDTESDGWGLGFGVRHQLGDQFEIRAQIDYYDGEADAGGPSADFNDTVYSFGGRYYWTPNVFTGVAVNVGGVAGFSALGDSGDVIRVDAGWSFGADVM